MVIISNHQGNFDIPVLVAILPFSPAFIAKDELTRIPLISTWMKALDCLPINRKNPRLAREKISERMKVKGKNPIVLFPEGTRSRGKHTGNLRAGSLKLIFQNKMKVLPVTIMGTYKAFEEKKVIQPAIVTVTFHPLVRTSDYPRQDFPKFLEDIRNIITIYH